tara:strand:- start:139 stop:1368 length:1230 start_codon:yes stop_codon:yes gene_type:complete
MSKSARETLFGITLTELVIILFFIMLLLAIFNIEDLTEQIPEDDQDVVPASSVVDLLIPDGEIDSDLIPLEVIAEEIRKLQEAKEELDQRMQAERIAEEETGSEGEGTGDCREGGFWITTKCSDHCWSIEDSSRQYDYLVDIGVCENYVVVQRSEWIQKTETDFANVEGAYEMVTRKQMSRTELYELLDTLKEPGYQLEPKQCFHSVRLIDLGSRSIDVWETTNKQVNSRVSPFVLTKANGSIYNSVRTRFNDDICSIQKEERISKDRIEYAQEVLRGADEMIRSQVKKSTERRAITEEPEKKTMPLPVITKAKMYSNFSDNFINNRDCKNIRGSRVTYIFDISVNESGEAYRVKYLDNRDNLSRSNRKLLDITTEALYQTKYFPALSDGRAIESVLRQPVTLPKGVCQ